MSRITGVTLLGRLGEYILNEPIGKGYTAAIYSMSSRETLAAKLYRKDHITPSQLNLLEQKTEAMLALPLTPRQKSMLAWPEDRLSQNGRFVGYVMPNIDCGTKLVHVIFPHARRIKGFDYGLKELTAIAYNLATVTGALHAANVVIGDFNMNNVVLNKKGNVFIIDNDAFVVPGFSDDAHLLPQPFVTDISAPEVIVSEFAQDAFTKQSDDFSLACLIFRLLCDGRHPFYVPGAQKLEKRAILKGDYNPSVTKHLSDDIRSLFERAFCYLPDTAASPETAQIRPTAEEWCRALREFHGIL